MSEPAVCDQPWLSDDTRRCQGRPHMGGACFAHDSAAWRDRLGMMQQLTLAGSEITGDFLDCLAGQLRQPGPSNVDLTDAVIVGDLDISGGVLGTVIANRATFAGRVVAHGARFTGRASFTDAHFDAFHAGSATFEDAASFHNATFLGDASFPASRFAGHADFAGVSFGPDPGTDTVSTVRSRSDDRAVHGADFTDAVFAAPASFAGATVHQALTFDRVAFHDRVDFDQLRGPRVHFIDARFEGTASFNGAVLDGPIFAGCRFQRDSQFITAALRPLPIPGSAATSFVFANVTFEGDVGLVTTGRVGLRDTVLHGNVTLGADTIVMAGLQLRSPLQITLLDDTTLRLCQLTLTQPLTVVGRSDGSPVAAPTHLGELTESTLLAPLTLADVTLTNTTFMRTTGLEHLRLVGDPAWPRYRYQHHCVGRRFPRRRILADEQPDGVTRTVQPATVEALYRQLRAGLEASKAAPAAADFYYGEMEMRRLATPRSLERALLVVYKWVGGYGVRAWRPLAAYLSVLAGTVAALVCPNTRRRLIGDTIKIDNLHIDRAPGALAFALRNSTSVFQAPAGELTGLGTTLFVLERFAAVALLALFVVALRSKVQR